MEIKHKKVIGLVVLVLLVVPSILATVYYYGDTEQEIEEELRLVPGNWTAELSVIYNDSEPIEFLKYHCFDGITINNDTESAKRIIIVAIPDEMESRGSFGTFMYVETWNDRNVLIGDNTKLFEKELPLVYVFANKNVSETMYERYDECYYPTLDVVEIVGIDLTEST